MHMSCLLSGFPYHQYQTGDHRKWVLGSAAQWLYSIDAADNLFPSIHCLVSWFCYIGIRDRKEIPEWYKQVSLGIAVLVFISTLLTKQHVLVDVAGGVLLGTVCFMVGKKTRLYCTYTKIGNRIEAWILKLLEG